MRRAVLTGLWARKRPRWRGWPWQSFWQGEDDEPSARVVLPRGARTDGVSQFQNKSSQVKPILVQRTLSTYNVPHKHHQCAACLRSDEPSRRPRAPGKRAAALPARRTSTRLSLLQSSLYTRFKACFKAQVMPRARGTAQLLLAFQEASKDLTVRC